MAEIAGDDLGGVRQFIQHLNAARKRIQLFPATHPIVAESTAKAKEALDRLVEGKKNFTVSFVAGELYADGRLMAEESLAFHELIADLTQRNIASLTFAPGMDVGELSALLTATVLRGDETEGAGGLEAVFARKGIAHVLLNRLTVASSDRATGGTAEGIRVARETYDSTVQRVTEAFSDAQSGGSLDMEVVDGMAGRLMVSVAQNKDVVMRLSTIKSFSEYTFFHSVNVAILTLLMGARLGLPDELLRRLGVAALLHDVGKVRVPLDILDKPGRLTEDEFAVMKSHSVEGLKIITSQRDVDPLVPVIAAEHHAHYDLKGYPDLTGAGGIHMLSHLVTIADVYDALTSDRCYRNAMLPDRAMQIILQGRGTQFHPLFLKIFVNVAGMFPVGALVELDTGELAVVHKANPNDIYRPSVKVLGKSEAGYSVRETVELSSRQPDGAYPRTITKAVDPVENGVPIKEFM